MKTSMKDVVAAIGAGVTHCDLCDGGVKDTVPFNHIETSYRKDLK